MSEEQVAGLIGQRIALSFAGEDSWQGYGLDEIATMLNADASGPADEHLNAWYLVKSVCDHHAGQLRRAVQELLRHWPPEKNQAALLFADYADGLVRAMERTAEAATYNRQALTAFTETLTVARANIAELQQKRAADPIGGVDFMNEYDEQARAVMVRTERSMLEAAWHTREPEPYQIPTKISNDPWPPENPAVDSSESRHGGEIGFTGGSAAVSGSLPSSGGSDDWPRPSSSVDGSLVRLPTDLDGLAAGGAGGRAGSLPPTHGFRPPDPTSGPPDPVGWVGQSAGTAGSGVPVTGVSFRTEHRSTAGSRNLSSSIVRTSDKSPASYPPRTDRPGSRPVHPTGVIGGGTGGGGANRGAGVPTSGAGMMSPPGAAPGTGTTSRRTRHGYPDDDGETQHAVPAVIEPSAEPDFHDPGPGVIGINR